MARVVLRWIFGKQIQCLQRSHPTPVIQLHRLCVMEMLAEELIPPLAMLAPAIQMAVISTPIEWETHRFTARE